MTGCTAGASGASSGSSGAVRRLRPELDGGLVGALAAGAADPPAPGSALPWAMGAGGALPASCEPSPTVPPGAVPVAWDAVDPASGDPAPAPSAGCADGAPAES